MFLLLGTYVGPKAAVNRAILIQQVGPPLELRINPTKCELISRGNLDGFPADMKMHHEPNFEILGAPIGDVIFCAKYLAQKRAKAVKLQPQLSRVGSFNSSNCTSFTSVHIIL